MEMHHAEDLGISGHLWQRPPRPSGRTTKTPKNPLYDPIVLWQTHDFTCQGQTEIKPFGNSRTAKTCTKQLTGQQAEKIWGYSLITSIAVRTQTWLQMRLKLSCQWYRRQMKRNLGSRHLLNWIYLSHDASGQFFTHQTLWGQFLLKEVNKHVHQSIRPVGIHARALELWGMFWQKPLRWEPAKELGSLGKSLLAGSSPRLFQPAQKGLRKDLGHCGSFNLTSAPAKFYF